MNKTNVRSTALLLAAMLLLLPLLSGCATADAEVFELRLAHFFPASHPAEEVFVQGWIERIEEATDGNVKVRSYAGQTLLDSDRTYSGVVAGEADIGMSVFSYTPGRFPVMEAFELPGTVYESSYVASKVAWEGLKELQPEEVLDTKMLMVISTGPGHIFSQEPIHTLEDLEGMEIRATGMSADTLSLLGGTPVGMPQPDTYDALARGVVAGNLAPLETLQGWNHAEVTDYITMTPFIYNTLFFLTMNLDRWQALPVELQETIEEVSEAYHEEVGASLWDQQNDAALQYAVEEHGLETIELDEDETARWIEQVMPVQEEYRQKLADLGIDQDPLALISELVDAYSSNP